MTLYKGVYKLYKSSKTTEKAGAVSWINNGQVSIAHNYMWDKQSGYTLSGYYDQKTYTTLDAALKVCAANDLCVGVTKEGDKKYRTNTGSTLSANSARTAYLQRSAVVTHDKHYFSTLSGYTLDSLDKAALGSEKAAAAACIKKATCTGFIKKGGKFYTATGWTVYSDDDAVSYIKNDRQLSYVSFSLYVKKYFWAAKSPYVHKKVGTMGYSSFPQAAEACLKNTKCTGVTYKEKDQKYFLGLSSGYEIGAGKTYTKGSAAVIGDGYLWNKSDSNKKLDGDYLDSSTFATLTAALKACSKKAACTGVTKINSKKYKLGKSETLVSKTGATAYVRGSSVITYRTYVWTKVSGFRLQQEKLNFKTVKEAMFACSKSATCTGVNRGTDGKFRISTSTALEAKDGVACWIKGGSGYTPQFTYDSTVWYYHEDYKTAKPLPGKSTFTTRDAALSACVRHAVCQSVHYVGKKYHLRGDRHVADAIGNKVWIVGSK